eukprot:14194413-Alexandrium_andersonii.AAC.1
MSASLVGSEMCIRDRSVGARTLTFWAAQVPTCNWVACTSKSATPRTVSYTHLTLPTICSV